MLSRFFNPPNAASSIVVSLLFSANVTLFTPCASQKHRSPIDSIFAGITISIPSNPASLNRRHGKCVSLSDVNDRLFILHLSNDPYDALSSNLVLSIFTVLRFSHPLNAQSPIFVTLAGIKTLLIFPSLKAESPISSTPSGIAI